MVPRISPGPGWERVVAPGIDTFVPAERKPWIIQESVALRGAGLEDCLRAPHANPVGDRVGWRRRAIRLARVRTERRVPVLEECDIPFTPRFGTVTVLTV